MPHQSVPARDRSQASVVPIGGAAPSEGSGSLGQSFVRVLGTRLDRFVEFEFSLRDADLTVELVLPLPAFEEFCATRRATVLPPSPEGAAALARLQGGEVGGGGAGGERPGLYRRPETTSDRTDT